MFSGRASGVEGLSGLAFSCSGLTVFSEGISVLPDCITSLLGLRLGLATFSTSTFELLLLGRTEEPVLYVEEEPDVPLGP